jgi:hypothetical protein
MWTSIKSLLFSKTQSTEPNLPHEFDELVRKTIVLIKNNDDVNSDEQLLKCLTNNKIDYTSAREIILFLPTAFIRHWIPLAKWSDTYIEFINEKRQIEKKYSKTKSYQIISKVTSEYFSHKPDKDVIFKIGGRSAEFNVINPLLNANPNLKVEEIQLSKTIIIRWDERLPPTKILLQVGQDAETSAVCIAVL